MRKTLAVLLAAALALPAALRADTGTLMPNVRPQFFTNAGAVCASCRVFFYASGTSTKQNAYSDVGLTTPLSNPSTLDSAGYIAAGGPFFSPSLSYKVVLAGPGSDDPPSSPIWTQDTVGAIPPAGSATDNDVTVTAGEAISAGDVIYISDGSGGATAGRAYRTDSDQTYSSIAAYQIGIAPSAISNNASGTMRLSGRVTGLSGLTTGALHYVSATTGALTATPPTNARPVGVAASTTSIILSPWALGQATSSVPGYVSTGTQTIAGAKTLSGATTFSSTTLHSGVATFTPLPLGVFQVAHQTADVTKNNNTTFTDLTGLSFAVAASGNYYFRCFLKVNSTGTAGVKVQLTGPAAPTALMFGLQSAALKVDPQAATAFSTTVRTGTGDIEESVTIEGFLRNGANAGTVQVQATQDTADATDTIFRAASFCIWMQQS